MIDAGPAGLDGAFGGRLESDRGRAIVGDGDAHAGGHDQYREGDDRTAMA
jgi:hypothetical protein